MKKLVYALVIMLTFSLIGCSSDGSSGGEGGSGDQVKLTVFQTMSDGAAQDVFKEIVADFEDENPNIKVEVNYPGSEYENILKVKMAANDMPDIFDTHGWAKIRYNDFLADLKGESWVADLSPTIKSVLEDEEGKIHAFPLNEAKDGIIYNVDVLEEYGVEVPKTFDELMAAAEKISNESKGEIKPFYIPGADSWTIGQYFDYFATPLLISDADNNYGEELVNGSFDWSKWNYLPEKLEEIQEKGLLNKDVLTAQYSSATKMFVEDKVVFNFYGGYFGADIKKMDPEKRVGLMPIPSIHEGDKGTFVGGERFTLGAWKDSENLEEAKKFIEFFAKAENAKKMAEATGLPAGLETAEAENLFSEYYEKYSDIEVYPYFDRVYLPNGMWDVMCTTGQEVLSGTITPEQASGTMEKEYNRLRDNQ